MPTEEEKMLRVDQSTSPNVGTENSGDTPKVDQVTKPKNKAVATKAKAKGEVIDSRLVRKKTLAKYIKNVKEDNGQQNEKSFERGELALAVRLVSTDAEFKTFFQDCKLITGVSKTAFYYEMNVVKALKAGGILSELKDVLKSEGKLLPKTMGQLNAYLNMVEKAIRKNDTPGLSMRDAIVEVVKQEPDVFALPAKASIKTVNKATKKYEKPKKPKRAATTTHAPAATKDTPATSPATATATAPAATTDPPAATPAEVPVNDGFVKLKLHMEQSKIDFARETKGTADEDQTEEYDLDDQIKMLEAQIAECNALMHHLNAITDNAFSFDYLKTAKSSTSGGTS